MCFGMRPEYVRVGLQYPNFKMIWFPTFTSYGFWRGPVIRKRKASAWWLKTARFCRR